jgi:1,4-dihydroxy-2-naphthoate octaprenyltransferase
LLYGLPLTFAAFNLFLVHGFPNPEEEDLRPRQSLAARVGPVGGALIFTLVNILTIAGPVVALLFPANPLPFQAGFILLIILAVVNQELIKKKVYRREARIKLLCRLTLAQHLAMGLVFTISLWQR